VRRAEQLPHRIGREGIEVLAAKSAENLPALRFVNLFGNRFDLSPRFAHDDGRIVGTWRPSEAGMLTLPERVVPWLDGEDADDILPDRFRMADAPIPKPARIERAYAEAGA
jgi:hypothetical protein